MDIERLYARVVEEERNDHTVQRGVWRQKDEF